MKTIKTRVILTSIRSKVDKSLGLTLSTPELTTLERAEFMDLQGVELEALFNPVDDPEAKEFRIDKPIGHKSQSKRIRSLLFVIWREKGGKGSFNEFYRNMTEKYLDYLKRDLR